MQFSEFGQKSVDNVEPKSESVEQKHEENTLEAVHGKMTTLVLVHEYVLFRRNVVNLKSAESDP